jgi:hypothetical protein
MRKPLSPIRAQTYQRSIRLNRFFTYYYFQHERARVPLIFIHFLDFGTIVRRSQGQVTSTLLLANPQQRDWRRIVRTRYTLMKYFTVTAIAASSRYVQTAARRRSYVTP